MSYIKWFNQHALKHKKIVNKLIYDGYSNKEIIEYFDFDNMVQKEIDFCPLYKDNNKCHNMKELNCYLCACPNFRFSDDGLESYNQYKILSKCEIHNGKKFASKGVIHQDCSSCSVPHHKEYILKNFSLEWSIIMKKCNVNTGDIQC